MLQDEISSLGDSLKKRRKELNVSLKEVENPTSIRVRSEAIEEGDLSKLISPVYAKGFIKQYAVYLGLDGEGLVKEYTTLFSMPLQQDFSYGIGTMRREIAIRRALNGFHKCFGVRLLCVGYCLVCCKVSWCYLVLTM